MTVDKVERAVIDLDGEWPDMSLGQDVLYFHALTKNYQALIGENGPYGGEFVCTHSEFMETRKRLENKPTEWPEGAKVLTFNPEIRTWIFGSFESAEPVGDIGWRGVGNGEWFKDEEIPGRCFGDWRNTLERRPEEKAKQKADPEGIEWDGEGLPPAGTVCEVRNNQMKNACWERCKIRFMGKFKAVYDSDSCIERIGDVDIIGVCEFRPIRSRRDKVVEAAFEVGASHTPVLDSHVRLVVEALADEDMLKLSGEQE